MTRILVTGANGFIGRALCKALKSSGYFVRGSIRKFDADRPVVVDEMVELGDISMDPQWLHALHDIDVVVHLAAKVHDMKKRSTEDLPEYRRANANGTERLAIVCSKAGVRRFILMSTIHVNGEVSLNRAFTEDDKPAPISPYAISKWEAEGSLIKIAKAGGFEFTIIRSPLVYGPYVKGNFLRLMGLVDKGIPLPLSNINNLRSLIGVENLADLISLCVSHPKAADQLFLVSDGDDISTTDLVMHISDGLGKKAHLFSLPYRAVRGALKVIHKHKILDKLYASLQVDPGKSRTLLGWSPHITVEEGIHKTTRWFVSC